MNINLKLSSNPNAKKLSQSEIDQRVFKFKSAVAECRAAAAVAAASARESNRAEVSKPDIGELLKPKAEKVRRLTQNRLVASLSTLTEEDENLPPAFYASQQQQQQQLRHQETMVSRAVMQPPTISRRPSISNDQRLLTQNNPSSFNPEKRYQSSAPENSNPNRSSNNLVLNDQLNYLFDYSNKKQVNNFQDWNSQSSSSRNHAASKPTRKLCEATSYFDYAQFNMNESRPVEEVLPFSNRSNQFDLPKIMVRTLKVVNLFKLI